MTEDRGREAGEDPYLDSLRHEYPDAANDAQSYARKVRSDTLLQFKLILLVLGITLVCVIPIIGLILLTR